MTEKTAPKHIEVTVLRDDANAYCRILTLLGMEEEGDPVAEVASLLADIEANAGLRAKVAQQAALVEKCMAAMNENADRGEKAEAKLAALEKQEPVAWLVYANGSHRYSTLTFDVSKVPDIYVGGDVVALYAAAGAASVPDIDGMVNRFLGWKLPQHFYPDCYVSFDREKASQSPHGWPIGTNLLTAEQARKMFEYVMASTPCQVEFHTLIR